MRGQWSWGGVPTGWTKWTKGHRSVDSHAVRAPIERRVKSAEGDQRLERMVDRICPEQQRGHRHHRVCAQSTLLAPDDGNRSKPRRLDMTESFDKDDGSLEQIRLICALRYFFCDALKENDGCQRVHSSLLVSEGR